MVVGAAGGPTIISATAEVLLNVVDWKLDAQAAVAAPRIHDQWFPDLLMIEGDIPRDVTAGLEQARPQAQGDAAHRNRQRAGADRQGDRGGRRAAQPERAGGLLMPARKITKVLIANRGEIACRVIRACRELDLRTVAVYSEADALALHVRLADEAIAIGPPPARESYLVVDKLSTPSARAAPTAFTRATASCPRTPTSPRRSHAAGATFIGPPPSAMRAMGIKTAARARMQAAGVPVVPGDNGVDGRGFSERGRGQGGRGAHRLPGDAEGGGRRRRPRHAPRRRRRQAGGGAGRRAARGQGGLRRRHRLSGEGDRPAAPHRDPGVRRRARRRGPPLRARLLDPAPQPEGDRGVAVAGDRRRDARGNGRGGGARRALGRLRRRRHHRDAVRLGGRAASTSWR